MKQTIKIQWRLDVGKNKYTTYGSGFELIDDFKKMSEENIETLGHLLRSNFIQTVKRIINPEYGTKKYFKEILQQRKGKGVK